MAEVLEATDVANWTESQIAEMSDSHLLQTIQALESVYRVRPDASDHRKYLSRGELENIFHLARQLVLHRLSSRQHD